LLLKFISLAALVAAVVLSLAPSAAAVPASAADRDCADFSSQAAAQTYFLSLGGPGSDPDRLDADGDGIACESNPCPCSYSTPPTTLPDSDGDGVRDGTDGCPYEYALAANGCPASLPDSDGDGVLDATDACPYEHASTADGCPAPPPPTRLRFSAYVIGVIDGDTIKVRRGFRRYTIRLIGIDTARDEEARHSDRVRRPGGHVAHVPARLHPSA
jgi:hypothetical protein